MSLLRDELRRRIRMALIAIGGLLAAVATFFFAGYFGEAAKDAWGSTKSNWAATVSGYNKWLHGSGRFPIDGYLNSSTIFIPYLNQKFCFEQLKKWGATSGYSTSGLWNDNDIVEIDFRKGDREFAVRCVTGDGMNGTAAVIFMVDDEEHVIRQLFNSLTAHFRAERGPLGNLNVTPVDIRAKFQMDFRMYEGYLPSPRIKSTSSDNTILATVGDYLKRNYYTQMDCGINNCSYYRSGSALWVIIGDLGPRGVRLIFVITSDKIGNEWTMENAPSFELLSGVPFVSNLKLLHNDWQE
ncbi:hypothetical protein [Neorhizobium galegae]|uniref:hypothetical protein n=1 Tax=Neorhizobium galegae TaxID=399 RepID=UPI001F1F7B07|nr:hypothetical protein [Neorhizobium galegae]UIK04985.1 hypothetical protein LZK81_20410 [Neorhizobium galegae]